MQSISLLGNGWLGGPLYENLIHQHLSVKVSSRSSKENFRVDIDDLDENISLFLDSKILIINIPSKNVKSFTWLIEKIEKSPIQKVLFVSSTSVCRNKNSTNPLYMIEELFKHSCTFETTILRFAGLVGTSRNPANFVKDKKSMENANERVNLIHLDDCIAIINTILKKDVWSETLNACADTHPTKEEFYSYVCKQSNVSAPLFKVTKEPLPPVVSNEKLKRVLSYSFIHSDLMKM